MYILERVKTEQQYLFIVHCSVIHQIARMELSLIDLLGEGSEKKKDKISFLL
jgi:hypothetical protein